MNKKIILKMRNEKSHKNLGNFPKNKKSVAFFEGKSWLGILMKRGENFNGI